VLLSRIRDRLGRSRRRWRPPSATTMCLVLFALVVLLVEAALARPGGGHSYSSGGSSGGGGSGGGGSSHGAGGAIAWILIQLLRLCVTCPVVGIPLAVVVVGGGVWLWWRNRQARSQSWETDSTVEAYDGTTDDGGSLDFHETPDINRPLAAQRRARGAAGAAGAATPVASPRRRLEALRTRDEDFSIVVLEDFLYALYSAVHTARGAGRLDDFGLWLSPAARGELVALGGEGLREVRGVVVGGMRLVDVSGLEPGAARVRVTAEFQTNYTQGWDAGGGEARTCGYEVVERWTLARNPETRSRPPRSARAMVCPACGAALAGVRGDTCAHCGGRVAPGEFDWLVEEVQTVSRTPRELDLGGAAPERGTSRRTMVDGELSAAVAALAAKDPSFHWQSFTARLARIFVELQAGWSNRDWARVRPWLTDRLFESWLSWFDAYERAGLRNVTEGARILRLEPARVTSDRWLDAFTVRVFATGLDFTVADDGRVVGGSRSEPREYSEYWTLIRGSSVRGASREDPMCPQCGAALKIGRGGNCEYCEARVTAGDFDWVLSRIEQDEVYQG